MKMTRGTRLVKRNVVSPGLRVYLRKPMLSSLDVSQRKKNNWERGGSGEEDIRREKTKMEGGRKGGREGDTLYERVLQ